MNQAAKDIERHFKDKLDLLIKDTLDTFARADVDCETAIAGVMAVLGYQMAFIAVACNGEEDRFVAIIQDCFRKVHERERKQAG